MELIQEAITAWFGPRCNEHMEGCPVCDAWKEYDELLMKANIFDSVSWHWPAYDNSEDACQGDPWSVVFNEVGEDTIINVERGGVVESKWYAYLAALDDEEPEGDGTLYFSGYTADDVQAQLSAVHEARKLRDAK